MLIDWFTVGAQVLNFLVLVWLLKRFLYKPILHAINERERRVATELANADKKEAEAKKERDEFQQKNEELDQKRASLLSKATEEAQAERKRLLDEARKAADVLTARRMVTLRNDEQILFQEISRQAQQEVFAIARKALTDLASTSLEERMGETFIRRLRDMDGKAKEVVAKALKTATAPSLVCSAFDMPVEQQEAIQNALNETFSAKVRVRFETAPDLISGIELITNGQKVSWSISDYLTSLEKGVAEILKEKNKPETKPNTPSNLTQQIAKRAYELYELHGHKSASAIQDWNQAEREIRESKTNAESTLEPETAPEPEAGAEPRPQEPKSEKKSQ